MGIKIEYNLEYELNTSLKVLFPRLSTPSGLSEWFADNVNIKGEIFTFCWGGTESKALKMSQKDMKFVKYQWIDDAGTNYFFEFKLETQDLTKDVALIITDYAFEDEVEEAKELWDSQILNLKRLLGI